MVGLAVTLKHTNVLYSSINRDINQYNNLDQNLIMY